MKISDFHFLIKRSDIIFITISLVIGLLTFKEYGVTTDELSQFSLGKKSYDFVFKGDDDYLEARNKDYGVAFQLTSYLIIEEWLNFKDSRNIILGRHLFIHIFFLAGALCAFLLTDLLFKNKWLAIAAFLFILLNPRIYTHSFFNPKDIPFLSMFLISLYLTALSLHKDRMIYKVLSGISIGLLINIRIMGIMLFVFVLMFYLIDLLFIKEKRKSATVSFVILLSVTLLTLYSSWPFLWKNPIQNFISSFENMSKFPWTGTNLYFGKTVDGPDTDWYFGPMWFLITVPLPYILLGVVGIYSIVADFFRSPLYFFRTEKGKNILLFLGCFLAPFVAVIILNSVLYNGWRQLYFVYAPFVFIMISGLEKLLKTKYKKTVALIMVVSFLFTGYTMVKLFPHNQVFFNLSMRFFPQEYLRKNFEFDYWGASYKQGLEYILEKDPSTNIRVAFERKPGMANVFILPEKDRNRLKVTNPGNAIYFLTNYRYHPQDYPEYENKSVFSIKVMDNTVLSVFKLH